MKRLIALPIALMMLAGCASSPLDIVSGVIGSKPDMTAQVGATNTKQGVGLTASNDASNSAESTIKDSTVGKVDSSSGKKMNASSITADIIRADTIQITNAEPDSGWKWVVFGVAGLMIIGLLIAWRISKKKAP